MYKGYTKGLENAFNATGHCTVGQNDCVRMANDTLGFPTLNSTGYVRSDAIVSDLVGRLGHAQTHQIDIPTSPPGFTFVKPLPDNSDRGLINKTSNGLRFFVAWLSDTNQGLHKCSFTKHMFDYEGH